jgi:hypothetical protein
VITNIQPFLAKNLSKDDLALLIAWVGNDRERIDQMICLFLSSEPHVIQRVSLVMMEITNQSPDLLENHLDKLVTQLRAKEISGTIKRNIVRLLQQVNLPEACHADLLEICFTFLQDRKEAIAVKAFSMTVLLRLAEIYPDIGMELKLVIEDGLRHNPSPGYRSRALKTLRQLTKLTDSISVQPS